jgi:hypothetical protein
MGNVEHIVLGFVEDVLRAMDRSRGRHPMKLPQGGGGLPEAREVQLGGDALTGFPEQAHSRLD